MFHTEITQSTQTEFSKSQTIRLLDVFLIAPFMFYIGYKAKGLKDWERVGMYVLAGATLYYNGRNYLKSRYKWKK